MENQLRNHLNQYLANTAVLYIKLHNLHWNVKGQNFKSVHEYLETIYDGFASTLDEIAEALKMQGEYPLASLKEYITEATIEEIPSESYEIKQVLQITLTDIQILINQAEEIRNQSMEDDNYSIIALIEGHLINLNKTKWFLESTI